MQQRLWDESKPLPRWIENKGTAKTGFLNLAMAILDGAFDDRESLSLEELRVAMPRPTVRGKGNGVTTAACTDCGRVNCPLHLNLQQGWLCALCHREFMVKMGYTDEYGNLLPE